MAVSLDGQTVTTYCDPEDVIRAIRMVDYYSIDGGLVQPSDSTLPDYDELCRRIVGAENYIDRMTNRSWKEHRTTTSIQNVSTYWHDINGRRADYWIRGGYYVQLHKNIRPFDPSKGDRIIMRTEGDTWVDVSPQYIGGENGLVEYNPEPEGEFRMHKLDTARVWFDYIGGKVFLRRGWFTPTKNAIQITYRWGSTEEIPYEIKRATALRVGLTLFNEDLYTTKLGGGGDLGSARGDMKRGMQDEINETIMMHRAFTGVYSTME